MWKRYVTLLMALGWLGLGPAARAGGALDGLTGVLEGQALWSVEGLADQSGQLFATVSFADGKWGFKDTAGNAASGDYQIDPANANSASLLVDPEQLPAVAAVIESGVSGLVAAQLGFTTPIQASLSDIRATATLTEDFSGMRLEVSVAFVAVAPMLQQSANGTLTVTLEGTTVGGPAAGGQVVVNGVPLKAAHLARLESRFGIRVAPGRYWYDKRSGLWGLAGGPSFGQIPPRLKLGGALRRKASGDRTEVLVNGRALHPVELAFLENRFGFIARGRYVLNSNGTGRNLRTGRRFNIASTGSGGRRSILGHSLTGSVIGDSSIIGFISYNGGTSVSCGPDGGCIYSGGDS